MKYFQFRIQCETQLSGYRLQLNLVVSSSQVCSTPTERSCLVRHQKILTDVLIRMTDTPLDIEFDRTVTERINIQLCSIHESIRKMIFLCEIVSHLYDYHTLIRKRQNPYRICINQ